MLQHLIELQQSKTDVKKRQDNNYILIMEQMGIQNMDNLFLVYLDQIRNLLQFIGFKPYNRSLIDSAIKQDWNKLKDQFINKGDKFFIFYGAWAIGLALTLILFPFLLCCCLCPWSCPLWNRKRQNMPYSQYQLKWPAVVTSIMLLIVLVVSIVGIASKFKAKNSYNEMACSSGIILDDLVNGNVSYTNSNLFFTGLRTLDDQLRNLNSKFTQLKTQFAKIQSTSSDVIAIKQDINTAKSSTASVPKLDQTKLVLEYKKPLITSSPSNVIQSTFPDILGTKQKVLSLVGAPYQAITSYQSLIDGITISADEFKNLSTSFQTTINSGLQTTNKTATDLQQKDKQLNNIFNDSQKIFKNIFLGEYIIYGILIGLSCLIFITVLFTACGKLNGCRKLMYFLCVFLFLLTIISFLICLIVSIINPFTYYVCSYLNQNLASKAKLQNTLINTFKIDSNIVYNVSVCLTQDSTGDIAKTLLPSEIFDTLQNLQDTFSNLSTISIPYGNNINKLYNNLQQKIISYKQAQVKDITDSDALNELIKVSKASQYTCNTPGFSEDSWIPSFSQNPSYILCQKSSGLKSDSSTCTNSADFNSRALGCKECMDTYDLFKGNVTSSDVKSALDSRYPDSSCTTFNTELSNLWSNFYKVKKDTLEPVQARATQAKTDGTKVGNSVSFFTQIGQNIIKDFSSIFNSSFGLLKGLNCKVIGQDIRLLRDIFCENLFVYTYFLRIIFGIISFALLFSMCFIVCVGHRQQKQFQFNREKYDKYKDQNIGKDNPPSDQGLIQMQKIQPPYYSPNIY